MEQEFHFFEEQDILIDTDSQELEDSEGTEGGERTLKVRLDKWLWAARFFKTRALARAAVEAGRVFYNGERSKPTREIELGAILQVRLGRIEKTVIVKGLSTRRRSTEEALSLFEETEESKALRELHSADFQDDRNFRNPFNPVSYQDNSRARSGRFLRRSFNRPEAPFGYPSSSYPNAPHSNAGSHSQHSQDDSEGFDHEEQQPLNNDSSFPYPQRRDSGYRNDHSNYRSQGGGMNHRNHDHRNHDQRNSDQRNYDPRNRMQNQRGYRQYDPSGQRQYDPSGQRSPENNYYRHPNDSGHRSSEGYGYRSPENSGYRNPSSSHYHSSYDQEPRHRDHHRNQDHYGHPRNRTQDSMGNRSHDSLGNRSQPPRGKKQEEEFENFD